MVARASVLPAQPASVAPGTPLTLAEAWLVALRDGRLSVADMAEWASLRVEEGGADLLMQKLALCSSERTLHDWVRHQPWRRVLPQPYSFSAPVANSSGGAEVQTLYCLLPHDMLASMSKAVPMVFQELFGTPAELETFWDEMERTSRELPAGHRADEHRHWLDRHPARSRAPGSRIPVGSMATPARCMAGRRSPPSPGAALSGRARPWTRGSCSWSSSGRRSSQST